MTNETRKIDPPSEHVRKAIELLPELRAMLAPHGLCVEPEAFIAEPPYVPRARQSVKLVFFSDLDGEIVLTNWPGTGTTIAHDGTKGHAKPRAAARLAIRLWEEIQAKRPRQRKRSLFDHLEGKA